ncbi:hypothetical protein Dacsa_0713 [Dactylococcopsis salina PCC 8305]|uniref:BrnT family toxin n=1 Tax=Dactylococcopsis salina (strain PCC 8305) TaxID=13035 RepID=K9YSI9_DACS8|nr:hypothetical protein Dacsa_0713 [Dactylococcopsis salina PCC 8305]
MEFEWDEGKRQSNRKKHDVDFVAVTRIFQRETVKWVDDRQDYGVRS